jgi:RsbRD-like negative regulator of sigma factor
MSDTPLPTPAAHPESINARLAAYLTQQKDSIMDELMKRLRKADMIETDALTNSELRSHVPQILEDLTRELLHFGSEDAAKLTHLDAVEHGAARWRQGFNLSELLRESGHLRTILIYHLCQFEEAHTAFGFAARYFANSTLHRILDDVMINAAQQFQKTQATEGNL